MKRWVKGKAIRVYHVCRSNTFFARKQKPLPSQNNVLSQNSLGIIDWSLRWKENCEERSHHLDTEFNDCTIIDISILHQGAHAEENGTVYLSVMKLKSYVKISKKWLIQFIYFIYTLLSIENRNWKKWFAKNHFCFYSRNITS